MTDSKLKQAKRALLLGLKKALLEPSRPIKCVVNQAQRKPCDCTWSGCPGGWT